MTGTWRRTNSVEWHYRIGDRIVGKLHRPFGERLWTMWVYALHGHSRKIIGFRKDEEMGKERVERAVAALRDKENVSH